MNRRDALKHSAAVTGLLLAAGLLPRAALAAYNQTAFDAKTVADVVKAMGAAAPEESKDVRPRRTSPKTVQSCPLALPPPWPM